MWETVIGLEIHVQLSTESKLFSSASTDFGADQNTQASVIDLAMPGVLPVLNKNAVDMAVKFGLAVDAKIARKSIFARKNYFYPDLPKGYQISQYELPIVFDGKLDIYVDGTKKSVGITRAHLEEDAGKSIHDLYEDESAIDLNRAGTPLIEIVSEPDMRSSREAVTYLKKIHSIVKSLGISDGNMQEGSFRCDANISLRKPGDEFGIRAEIKNINSFKFVESAINYEITRQKDILESGESVIQETRLYDPKKDETRPMRSKEEANDYRYFPDPDLLPIEIDDEYILELKENLPELPEVKADYYKLNYSLSDDQINIILSDFHTTNFIDQSISFSKIDPKKIVNYFISSIYVKLNKEKLELPKSNIKPEDFCIILDLIESKKIAKQNLKVIVEDIWSKDVDIKKIIDKYLNEVDSDSDVIDDLIKKVILENEKQVDQYKNGKTKIIGFFVGQVLKDSKGSDPSIIKDKIIKFLDSI